MGPCAPPKINGRYTLYMLQNVFVLWHMNPNKVFSRYIRN